MRDWNRTLVRVSILGPLALMPVLAGCFGHITPAAATMGGVDAPVLLGPVDHVGGGAPLAFEKVREFEATAKHTLAHSDSGGYSTTLELSESSMGAEAEYATRNDRYKDIRLTEIKPQAVGVISMVKARVDVEGDVVKVKPRKAVAQ